MARSVLLAALSAALLLSSAPAAAQLEVLETRDLIPREPKPSFSWARTAIPEEWTSGREAIAVRFRSTPGSTAGGVFGLAILRR